MDAYLELWSQRGSAAHPLGAEPLVIIGRDRACAVVLAHDPEVSRRHAMLERLPVGWSIRDLGSRNGTFVAGRPVRGTSNLEDRDEIRVGRQRIVFRAPATTSALPPTASADPPPELTRREGDVLRALLAPVANGQVFTEPASIRDIAVELTVSEAAVKQHFVHLYRKFGIDEGERRRVRLANEALRRGAVRLCDLQRPGLAG